MPTKAAHYSGSSMMQGAVWEACASHSIAGRSCSEGGAVLMPKVESANLRKR